MAAKFTDVFLQHNRLSAWATSAAMVGFGAVLMTKGNSFTAGSPWRGFDQMGATEIAVAVPLVGIGVMRLTALWINGRWRRSPILRAVGAVAGFACFTTLTITLLLPWLTGEARILSTGVVPYAVLAILDLIEASRAGADVGAYKRDHARTMAMVRDVHNVNDNRHSDSRPEREDRAYRPRRQAPAYGHDPIFVSRRAQPFAQDGVFDRAR